MSASDEGYSRNASGALNLISTFLSRYLKWTIELDLFMGNSFYPGHWYLIIKFSHLLIALFILVKIDGNFVLLKNCNHDRNVMGHVYMLF